MPAIGEARMAGRAKEEKRSNNQPTMNRHRRCTSLRTLSKNVTGVDINASTWWRHLNRQDRSATIISVM